jgi:2,3-bisphosphoglycerate-independent phosphoglycerate mutase
MMRPKPVMLMILDGWGLRASETGNAVALARTPNLDRLLSEYPHTRLHVSGAAVGLPDGVMGNSEVGHLNIGAGRVVYQDLLRIDVAIENGSFYQNPAINHAFDHARNGPGALHLLGLVSDGGVHSHLHHLLTLLDMAKRKGLTRVFVHAILDGRDTAPDGGQAYVARVQAHMQQLQLGAIATICGRYYAMDRDTRWDRTQKAYQLLTQGTGIPETDPVAAVKNAYARGETDEFVTPTVLVEKNRKPLACIQDHDAVFFFNFRADRARQITRAFMQDEFNAFERQVRPKPSQFACMTQYEESFNLPVAFPPEHLDAILGDVLSRHGIRQLRIAETEKYAHVTYFFNGGEEDPFEHEERCLIPSPRDVPTYDHKPQMSAFEVTDEVLRRIASDRYDFMVLNFANMDMVGHTGVLEAAIQACETVDECVGRICTAIIRKGGVVLITADHGNAELMRDDQGKIQTAHTTNPVRLVLVHPQKRKLHLKEGILGDIAPTILAIMDLPQPPQMTGQSLIGE